jgi:hypothetical protein
VASREFFQDEPLQLVSLDLTPSIRHRSSVRLTLENVSKIEVDFIKVTFDDSTIGAAQAALTEGEMSAFDTYETEYELTHRPVFSWSKSESEQSIGASRRTTVAVSCFGKIGWYVRKSRSVHRSNLARTMQHGRDGPDIIWSH